MTSSHGGIPSDAICGSSDSLSDIQNGKETGTESEGALVDGIKDLNDLSEIPLKNVTSSPQSDGDIFITGSESLGGDGNDQYIEADSNIIAFNVLVDGEASYVECHSSGLFFAEEALAVDYRNVVYFEIPKDDSSDVFEFDSNTAGSGGSVHNLAAAAAESLDSNSLDRLSTNAAVNNPSNTQTPTGGGGMSRQSSVDRMSSPGALTNQDMPPIPVVNDDDLDSYDQIYEGLFIGVLSFVLTVNPKGEPEVLPSSLLMEFQSLSDLQFFNEIIKCQIAKQTWRPKKVLLFLNPASGRGKAVDVYEQTLANVLRSAGIVADVRITEKDGGNSVKGVIFSTDYSVYDAIVIVGGDGSYRDAISAIYEKMHNQGRLNLDTDCVLPPIDIKFAIIPSGSGNGVVHYLTRSFTIEQAAYALVLGRTTPLPVVCVRNVHDFGLIGFAIVCVNYGITSDAIVVADKWKFLGPGKYIIGVTSAMLKHKSFRASIEIETLRQQTQDPADSDKSTQNKTIQGEFKDFMMLVNGISDSSEAPRIPRTNSDVFVTPGCSIYQQTGFLVNLGLYSQKIYSDPLVTCFKTNQVTFSLTDANQERQETKNFINIDGDIYPLKEGAFKITYFPSLIQAYALGFSHDCSTVI